MKNSLIMLSIIIVSLGRYGQGLAMEEQPPQPQAIIIPEIGPLEVPEVLASVLRERREPDRYTQRIPYSVMVSAGGASSEVDRIREQRETAARTIQRPIREFLERERAEEESSAKQTRQDAAARTIQDAVRKFLAQRKTESEGQWWQEKIDMIQGIGEHWNGVIQPERQRLEEAQQAAVRDSEVVRADEVRQAYERLSAREQAIWDNANAAERRQLAQGYQRIQAAERQFEALEQQLNANRAALPRAEQVVERAVGNLPHTIIEVAKNALAQPEETARDAAVAALGKRYKHVKRAYDAKKQLEAQIAQDQANIAVAMQEYHAAFGALSRTQQDKWRSVHDVATHQILRGEYDDIAALTAGDPVEPIPDLMRRLNAPLTEAEARHAQFEQGAVNPFLEQARDEYVDTFAHVPPLVLSKSLREAEALGKNTVEHVLKMPTEEHPIVNYQDWSHDLGDLIAEGNAFEGTRRGAITGNTGQDLKGENRDAIIAHLEDSQVAKDLAWMAYGTSDPSDLSYAQKGALIKGYLAATGRDPHNPNRETWDEARYAALRAGVPGLLPFQEIVGRMRMCQREEEQAHDDGSWDDDFDC